MSIVKLKSFLLVALLVAFPVYAADAANGETKTLIWPDGTRYVGGVEDGKRSGKGTIYWQDGTRFVGNFRDDLRNGPGTMILPDGTVYNGYFRDDKLVEAPAEPAAPEVAVQVPEPVVRPTIMEPVAAEPAIVATAAPEPGPVADDSGTVATPEPEPVRPPEPVTMADPEPIVRTEVVAIAPDAAAVETPPAVIPPPQQPEIAGELPVTEVNSDVKNELIGAVDLWATAWSGQDVAGYLAAYSADFDVPGQLSRRAWESLRRSRLARPSYIEVEVVYEQFELVEPDIVEVAFRQTYRSDVYSDVTEKVLRLRKEATDWRIIREFSR